MKISSLLILSVFLFGCTLDQVENTIFQNYEKSLVDAFVQRCGKQDTKCISAVKAQTKECMEKSDWRKNASDQSEAERIRFASAMSSCIVDENGKPFFEIKK